MLNSFVPKIVPLWDNMEKYGTAGQATDGNLIRRRCLGRWIIKSTHTHTHRICNTYCFSTATMVSWTRRSVTLHVRHLCSQHRHEVTAWRPRIVSRPSTEVRPLQSAVRWIPWALFVASEAVVTSVWPLKHLVLSLEQLQTYRHFFIYHKLGPFYLSLCSFMCRMTEDGELERTRQEAYAAILNG
jgi:hypothetical protein